MKVAGLQHKCFSMKLAQFFRATILKNICKRVLLKNVKNKMERCQNKNSKAYSKDFLRFQIQEWQNYTLHYKIQTEGYQLCTIGNKFHSPRNFIIPAVIQFNGHRRLSYSHETGLGVPLKSFFLMTEPPFPPLFHGVLRGINLYLHDNPLK